MKKLIFAFTVFTLLFALVACGKTSNSTDTSNASGSLSLEMQLLVGTFKLEETDQAVTAAQAEQLLPLWQTLQSLSTSGTAATEELDAVINQIKSTMTSQQMDKITAMKLTQQDVMSVMGQAGGAGAMATPDGSGQYVFRGNSQGAGPGAGGGDAPGGGPSGGGGFIIVGGPPDMGNVPGGDFATPQAARPNGMTNQVPAPLLNALIELLQKKVQQ